MKQSNKTTERERKRPRFSLLALLIQKPAAPPPSLPPFLTEAPSQQTLSAYQSTGNPWWQWYRYSNALPRDSHLIVLTQCLTAVLLRSLRTTDHHLITSFLFCDTPTNNHRHVSPTQHEEGAPGKPGCSHRAVGRKGEERGEASRAAAAGEGREKVSSVLVVLVPEDVDIFQAPQWRTHWLLPAEPLRSSPAEERGVRSARGQRQSVPFFSFIYH